MAHYRITRLADEDLIEIAQYTEQTWGERQCEEYIRELFELFDAIGMNPGASARMDFIKPGLKKRLHHKRKHAVYFRLGDDGIPEILRILHTAEDRHQAFA